MWAIPEVTMSLGHTGRYIRILLKGILKVYGVNVDWIYLEQGRARLF